MSGCDWQNKSFSVSLLDTPAKICRCGKETDGLYRHNGDVLCRECFTSLPSKPFSGEFATDKDKAYEFVTDVFDGKPVQISSKRQFKNLLKKHKMIDASIKECRQEADFRKRINNEEHRNKIKGFARELFLKRRKELTFKVKK